MGLSRKNGSDVIHKNIKGRDGVESHPISAITNLTNTINEINLGLGNINNNKADKSVVNDVAATLNNNVTGLNTERAERIAEIGVERQRINSFTALAAGSTTGDAELIDARISSSGVIHPNLGAALRNQLSQININMVRDKKLVNPSNWFDLTKRTNDKSLSTVNGDLVSDPGYWVSDFIPVVYGETLSAFSKSTLAFRELRYWCMYDINFNFITYSTNVSSFAVPSAEIKYIRVSTDVGAEFVMLCKDTPTYPSNYFSPFYMDNENDISFMLSATVDNSLFLNEMINRFDSLKIGAVNVLVQNTITITKPFVLNCCSNTVFSITKCLFDIQYKQVKILGRPKISAHASFNDTRFIKVSNMATVSDKCFKESWFEVSLDGSNIRTGSHPNWVLKPNVIGIDVIRPSDENGATGNFFKVESKNLWCAISFSGGSWYSDNILDLNIVGFIFAIRITDTLEFRTGTFTGFVEQYITTTAYGIYCRNTNVYDNEFDLTIWDDSAGLLYPYNMDYQCSRNDILGYCEGTNYIAIIEKNNADFAYLMRETDKTKDIATELYPAQPTKNYFPNGDFTEPITIATPSSGMTYANSSRAYSNGNSCRLTVTGDNHNGCSFVIASDLESVQKFRSTTFILDFMCASNTENLRKDYAVWVDTGVSVSKLCTIKNNYIWDRYILNVAIPSNATHLKIIFMKKENEIDLTSGINDWLCIDNCMIYYGARAKHYIK